MLTLSYKERGKMKNRRTFSDLLFIIIVLFLAFASFISYQRITKQNQASNLVAHANLVRFKLGETLTFLRSAEKRIQDSMHAEQEAFNVYLQKDSLRANQILHELDSLVRGDKHQQAGTLQLGTLLHKWQANIHDERTRAIKSSADLSNYISEGQAILNRVQLLFVEMRHVEDEQLLQKIQEKDRSALLIPLYVLVFSFIAIFLVTGTYFRLRSETRLRLLADARYQSQEAESRSRLAIEAARMGTFDWDLQNQHFLSSERLVEIFGYHDAGKVGHQDLIDRFHPDDKQIRDEAVDNSFTIGSLKYEARIIWPDKSVHWINVYGKIFADEARKIKRMYGTVVDITPQKIALDEIKESEAKFRLLANAMPQQIWTADNKGNLNYCNQAVFDFSGLSFSDLEKRGWTSIVHPDEQKENIKTWIESVKTGSEFIFEHRFRNVNGEYRWQLSRAIPQKDGEGNIQMWIGTSTDIQEQKHFMQDLERKVFERTQSLNFANLSLKLTVSQLEQTNAELASFNYIASHDLQEPLRKIKAFSKRIEDLERESLTDPSRDYFNRIIQAATRMQNLIDAFLSYSQTSNTRAIFEPADFNTIFGEVKNEFADIIEQKNICIECQTLPVLKGIPIQISQLFTNLIGNAIKYSRTGVQPKIEILAEEIEGTNLFFEEVDIEDQYWKISIRDNGIGFDQVYENQIFELFQRLHSRQEYEGTGIGLAICKKIMRNHKGFISASGQIGTGAVFSMYFPSLSES